ncbi:hypothetical protein OIDMADRAFT_52737 [Oidiodendron maius Zn]|uniref:Uncharacterized protein n=1 Tax=Oidiodendron maius (strain Zn) TaxID=913774 RepID=A0A0C3CV81_OIDMZ|nr:hypothetical protein OIDMADRAFT_52737 [Oidiodendron maius Zn]
MSPPPSNRQRPVSPYYESNLHHTGMLPPPHDEDVEGSMENTEGNDFHESDFDNILSKRQKLSDSLGSRTALSSHDRQSQHSLSISVDAEDNKVGGSESIFVDNLTSTAKTIPDILESGFLTEPRLCSEVTDTCRD